MTHNLTKYIRFVARRERLSSLIWLALFGVLTCAFAAMYPAMYPTQFSLLTMWQGMKLPPMVAMMGPAYGSASTLSAALLCAEECLAFYAIACAIMNIFIINKYTRIDEELGRNEMIGSLPVGRLTPSLAAFVYAVIVNVLLTFIVAFAFRIGNPQSPLIGAFAFASSVGVQGIVFAAITLLAAQVFSTATASSAVSFALLAGFYIMRAVGDVAGNVLSYISPLGLGLKVEAFFTDSFLPCLVLLIEAAAIMCAALAINTVRDIGMGIIPAGKGRGKAGAFLGTPMGYALNVSLKMFWMWLIGVVVIGAAYGSIIGDIDKFVNDNAIFKMLLSSYSGVSMADAFIPLICKVTALIATIPVVATALRLRSEEKRGRLEQIVAKAVPKGSLYWSFIAITLVECVVFMMVAALGFYAAAASTGKVSAGIVFTSFFSYIPAALVVASLAALIVGWAKRASIAPWIVLVYSFIMIYFGALFKLPEFAVRLAPFSNVAQYPIESLSVAPLVVMLALSAAMFIAGAIGFQRRDVSEV